MNPGFFDAFVLGLVEGLTEFLPVSSTGHLIVASDLLGLEGEKIKTFEVCIQFGAILAVGLIYFKKLCGLLDFSSNKGFSGKNGIICMLLGCLPPLVVGALFSSHIKELLFYPVPVGLALIAGAILMFCCEKSPSNTQKYELDQLTPKQAFFIGLFQTLSLWPGFSRAGSSIAGALLLGLKRKAAAEFSFLMAVPLITAATAYDIYQNWFLFTADDLKVFAFGSVVAFCSAYLAVKGFVALLSRVTLVPFAVYRLAVGILIVFYYV